MKLFRGNGFSEYLEYKNSYFNSIKGCVLAIGNFDGLHKGHVSIINQVKLLSEKHKLKSAVMLFAPSPKIYFSRKNNSYIPNTPNTPNTPKRVLPFRDQLILLKQSGIDFVFLIRFNESFSNLSPENFIDNYLINKLSVKHLVIGEDFRFGHKGLGDYDFLKNYNKKINVIKSETFFIKQDLDKYNKISSTWIRECLNKGYFDLLKKLLGREYILSGKVAYGNQLGRKIGFATINIKMPSDIALSGVFCVKVLLQDKIYEGVANIGFRPTIRFNKLNKFNKSHNKCVLEIHVFNFNKQVYGCKIKVIFYKKLREEIKFPSLDKLKNQLFSDVNVAKEFFA